ncbi:MAG TPA: hypothetical protein PLD59_06290 [Tepidisphaeraceae bacterium]|nr:hypothetical protein [Tepidisphaeraceae bacterium]
MFQRYSQVSGFELELLEKRRLLSIDAPQLLTADINGGSLIYSANWSRVTAASRYRVEWGIDGLTFPSFTERLQPEADPQNPDAPIPFIDGTAFSGEPRYYRVRAISASSEVSAPSNVEFTTGPTATAIDGAEQLTAKPDEEGVLLQWPSLRVNPYYRISRWGYHAGFDDYRWLQVGEVWATTSPAPARDFLQEFYDPTPLGAGGAEYRVDGYDFSFLEPPEFPYSPVTRGFVHARSAEPLVENRGKVLPVVDDRFETLLVEELAQFRKDLIGDGWQIHGTEWVATTDSVTDVKGLITDAYTATSQQLTSVILIGRVPVPRSGTAMDQGDGHNASTKPPGSVHGGAWVADSYYGDMTEYSSGTGWTDNSVDVTQSSLGLRDPENENVPLDGKFDQRYIPSSIELSVGRIDFYKLTNSIARVQAAYAASHPSSPALGATEAEAYLLGRYFERNHDYRLKFFEAQRLAKIDSNQGLPGTDFLRSAATLVGYENASYSDYSTAVTGSDVLTWSYIGGSGNHDNVNPTSGAHTLGLIGTPGHASLPEIHSVFNQFRGSWMGDWDRAPTTSPHEIDETLMNAILAHEGEALASIWSGTTGYTDWYLHRMGSGATLGESYLDSMNGYAKFDVANETSFVSRSILGDPTLRLHVVAPVSNVTVIREEYGYGGTMHTINSLAWEHSPDPEVIGYHVYRAVSADGPFTRLTGSPVAGTFFNDTTPIEDAVYMVRAVKLEDTPSGTYYNASTGILAVELGGGGGAEMMMSQGGGGWFTTGGSSSAPGGAAWTGGAVGVSIFDDLFSADEAALNALSLSAQQSAAATSPQISATPTLHTGPVLVFNFALSGSTDGLTGSATGGPTAPSSAQRIDVYLPAAGNADGRRVQLFDATTNRLLAQRDIASVGAEGSTFSVSNLPAGGKFAVRLSSLTGAGTVTAAARVA